MDYKCMWRIINTIMQSHKLTLVKSILASDIFLFFQKLFLIHRALYQSIGQIVSSKTNNKLLVAAIAKLGTCGWLASKLATESPSLQATNGYIFSAEIKLFIGGSLIKWALVKANKWIGQRLVVRQPFLGDWTDRWIREVLVVGSASSCCCRIVISVNWQ